MWWNFGFPTCSLWFVFPLIGFILMILMIIVMLRLSHRRDGLCGFGRNHELENLKKEMRELRAEIEALRRQLKEGIS